ncbi:TatD family hydrolase [archaeon]|nr:TatD family hydrolase [archaeon]
MIYDTHAHLDFVSEDKLEEIENNYKIGVVVSNSVNIFSNKKNLEISKKYSKIKFAAGLYPEETLKKEDYEELEKFVKENKKDVFSIGEIGMDFSRELPEKEIQEYVFEKQLELAEKLNLCVSIHTRKAEREIIEILREFPKVKRILHCFSGNFKLVKEALQIGCYFSIPTNIVRSEHFQKMVREIPREKILTETDTPYLSPFKETENEPANIVEAIKVISRIWEVSKEEAEKQIEDNFKKLFLN